MRACGTEPVLRELYSARAYTYPSRFILSRLLLPCGAGFGGGVARWQTKKEELLTAARLGKGLLEREEKLKQANMLSPPPA